MPTKSSCLCCECHLQCFGIYAGAASLLPPPSWCIHLFFFSLVQLFSCHISIVRQRSSGRSLSRDTTHSLGCSFPRLACSLFGVQWFVQQRTSIVATHSLDCSPCSAHVHVPRQTLFSRVEEYLLCFFSFSLLPRFTARTRAFIITHSLKVWIGNTHCSTWWTSPLFLYSPRTRTQRDQHNNNTTLTLNNGISSPIAASTTPL